ncbi:MAG TPA: hypothetical protein VM431_04195 [Phycisphaerae bacterium]|nr:hypothetical protein [Phycisphaerae bacterium]
MGLGAFDIAAFVAFMVAVIVVSLYAGRRERSSEDYFLAGRTLTWGLIGFSLIASNISTEHFVGMAGSAFGRVGLAIASYEWMSAITLTFVAWWLLPKFLRAGIYTIPCRSTWNTGTIPPRGASWRSSCWRRTSSCSWPRWCTAAPRR